MDPPEGLPPAHLDGDGGLHTCRREARPMHPTHALEKYLPASALEAPDRLRVPRHPQRGKTRALCDFVTRRRGTALPPQTALPTLAK